MNEFQEQILDHYKNPRNFWKPDWSPMQRHKAENLLCGDEIEVFVQIQDNKLVDIAFYGNGCSIAIAAASLLYQTVKGKDLDYIKSITIETVLGLLGIPLGTARIKCAQLCIDALKGSAQEYL